MTIKVSYLGPEGTYSQIAALFYKKLLQEKSNGNTTLRAYSSISQVLAATACRETSLAIVPVENSIEGGVTTTLDSLWQLRTLRIQQAITIPICHSFLSYAASIDSVDIVYSHPQAISQCQQWLDMHLPGVKLIPTNSTTEALELLQDNHSAASISSEWAAKLYGLPTLARNINDHSDNRTKFWVLGDQEKIEGQYTSIAFSLLVNEPGALLKALEIFAAHSINLSRIESRPTKRSLGDYLFFLDLETSLSYLMTEQVLAELKQYTEDLVIFGSYDLLAFEDYNYIVLDKTDAGGRS